MTKYTRKNYSDMIKEFICSIREYIVNKTKYDKFIFKKYCTRKNSVQNQPSQKDPISLPTNETQQHPISLPTNETQQHPINLQPDETQPIDEIPLQISPIKLSLSKKKAISLPIQNRSKLSKGLLSKRRANSLGLTYPNNLLNNTLKSVKKRSSSDKSKSSVNTVLNVSDPIIMRTTYTRTQHQPTHLQGTNMHLTENDNKNISKILENVKNKFGN
jgi:hypothetical protein